ncbi:MAG: phosphatidylserine decarboxylase [Deltaproteobacteria bacterium RIFCSPLOWO2_02_FULL_47_10]|nr:MAG: phosphatidylserine decarboxylase [Deltaproteobacteria bacterium RIFCSPLOWO2_02_FULL_47_10]
MNCYITREGWPYIGVSFAILMVAAVIGSIFLTAVFAVLFFFVVWFFRNPERDIPEGNGIIVSPADGKVIDIGQSGDLTKVSIFMSVFNVHVNRIPADGVVKGIEYNKGKFLTASKDKASLENEQNAVTIELTGGGTVKFVQIAGLIARRIVCYLKEGDRVRVGERFGMIKFGSRVDVYLPPVFKVLVKEGEKIKAGSTIIGSQLHG